MIKHEVIVICDKCKTETDRALSWAHINISAPDETASLNLCPKCWQQVQYFIHGGTLKEMTIIFGKARLMEEHHV
jgi:hypothetical protein